MITVRECCNLIKFAYQVPDEVSVSSIDEGRVINPDSALDMAAYGDFLVDRVTVFDSGIEITLKQQFAKA